MELLDAERAVYRLPKPQRNGTTAALTLTSLELIDQLAALILPPQRYRDRYHARAPAERAPARSGRRVWA